MNPDEFLDVLPLERCPHCHTDRPTLELRHRLKTNNYKETNNRIWGFYECKRCGGIISLAFRIFPGQRIFDMMFPKSITLDDSIPERAKHHLQEAINCLHSPSASIVSSASAVDAMLKEKGLTKGNLNDRINTAATSHLITEEMKEWANQIRLGANSQRHADITTKIPTTDEANRMIEFARALAEFLFVLPSRVKHGIDSTKPVASPKQPIKMQGGRGVK